MSSRTSSEDVWHKDDQPHAKKAWIDKRMLEMKLKNEKVMQRHALVEKDRIDAERQKAAVTAGCSKAVLQLPKRDAPVRHIEKKSEREWDRGKSTDGSWSEFKQTRHPNRGHSDRRPDRRDFNWRDREDIDKKEQSSHRYDRRLSHFRGRNQDSSQRHPPSNSNNYQTYGGRRYKGNESFNKGNWNDFKSQQFSDNTSILPASENPSNKSSMKVDNDKVWHDEELNEAHNKQTRTESWVKSINAEDWGECEGNSSERFVTARSDEYTEGKPKLDWCDDLTEESNIQKQSHCCHKPTKYEKPIHSKACSYNDSQNGEKVRKSSTSDSSRKEDGRPIFSDKNKQRFRKDTHPAQNRRVDHSYNAKESNHQSSKFIKPKLPSRPAEYGNYKSSNSDNLMKQQNYLDNSGSWGNYESESKSSPKNKISSGTWSDNEDGIVSSETAWPSTGGTWSDQDNDQACPSSNVTGDWSEIVERSFSDDRRWKHREYIKERHKNQIPIDSTWISKKPIRKPLKKLSQSEIDIHPKTMKKVCYQKCNRHGSEASSDETISAKDFTDDATENAKEDSFRLKRMAYSPDRGKMLLSIDQLTSSNSDMEIVYEAKCSTPKSVCYELESVGTDILAKTAGRESQMEDMSVGTEIHADRESQMEDISVRLKRMAYGPDWGKIPLSTDQLTSSNSDMEIVYESGPKCSTPKSVYYELESVGTEILAKTESQELIICDDEYMNSQERSMEIGSKESDLYTTCCSQPENSMEKMRCGVTRSECDFPFERSEDINICDKLESTSSQRDFKGDTLISTSDVGLSSLTIRDITIKASPIYDKSDFEQNYEKDNTFEALSSANKDNHFSEVKDLVKNAQVCTEENPSFHVAKVPSKCTEKETSSPTKKNGKPTENLFKSENNSGALSDNDNDWSTVDDDSENGD